MPSTTLIRSIAGVPDERIVLSNSHFARPHGITSWNKLRIAFRWSMRDSGATLTGTPAFAAGLCSGTANIFGDLTCTHFVGMRTIGATWPRSAGPPVLYQLYPTQSCKLIGTTFTVGTNWLSVAGQAVADAAGGNRFCWFIDITKGSPNYTLQGYARITGNAADISEATMKAQAEIDAATLAEHGLGNSAAVAVDEGADGLLNHVCFSWDRSSPEIEISDHGVFKLA